MSILILSRFLKGKGTEFGLKNLSPFHSKHHDQSRSVAMKEEVCTKNPKGLTKAYRLKFSMTDATPSPPPQQEEKKAYFPPRRAISFMANMHIRAPDAPLG